MDKFSFKVGSFCLLLVWWLLCLLPSVYASDLPTDPVNDIAETGRPNLKVFTDRKGLPQNSILALELDKIGYIWAGTQDGAAYFNGRTWTVVNMPNRFRSNYISSILAAEDGSMWFATEGNGIHRLKDQTWASFDQTIGLASNSVNYLFETFDANGKSTIWAATANGIARFDGNSWISVAGTEELPNRNVKVITETTSTDGKHILWIGTEKGLGSYSDGKWTSYTQSNSPLPNDSILSFHKSSSKDGDKLWIGTESGLVSFQNGGWKVHELFSPNEKVRAISETTNADGSKVLWVGTENCLGIFEKGHWHTLRRSDGLPSSSIYSLLEVSTSNLTQSLWIGTYGGGLACFEQASWYVIDKASGLPENIIYSLMESRAEDGAEELWVGTESSGIAYWHKGKWRVFNTLDGLPSNEVISLAETKVDGERVILVGTNAGIAYFKNGTWINNSQDKSLPNVGAYAFTKTRAADGTEAFWVGLRKGGLAYFANGKWKIYTTKTSGLPQDSVYTAVETRLANGRRVVWAGTRGGGLAMLDPEKESWTVYTFQSGTIPNDYVYSLLEVENQRGERELWAGTRGGVSILNLDRKDAKWERLSERLQSPLPNNIVYQMKKDHRGRIYLCTNRGVTRLTPTSDGFYVYAFTIENGLPSNECNGGASMVDSRGRIWVGTVAGIGLFDPANEIEKDKPKRPLLIEKVLIGGKETDLEKEFSLSYKDTNIVFEFVLLSYFRDSEVRYKTQLIGLEESESKWTSDYKREFTNLSAGNYTFKVWARDDTGTVYGPKSVSFNIRPAPWRTWWAYVLYAAVLVYVGYQLNEVRIKNINRRQEEKIYYLRQLLKSTHRINSQLKLTILLQCIAEEAARLVGGKIGNIGLVEGDFVVFKYFWKDGWKVADLSIPKSESIIGLVASSKKPVIVDEQMVNRDLKLLPEELIDYYKQGLIVVPIIDRNEDLVGLLEVGKKPGRPIFGEAECQLLEALAYQASVAIENAELYEELDERKIELEEKNALINESMEELEKLYKNEQEVTRALQELDHMKTNFLIVTSHEMRTPLTVIKGNNELLLEGIAGPLNASQERSLKTTQRMVERMVKSFTDILEMLKINEGQVPLRLATVDVKEIVLSTVEQLSEFIEIRQQKVKLSLPDKIEAFLDREKIELVLINIIQNAIKFTPDQEEIEIKIDKQYEELEIVITDRGIGIDPTEIERIFDKFYTSSDPSSHTSGKFEFSARGTGLGLSIARSYVEAHGGKIWAESEGKGRGSSFYIILPLITSEELLNKGLAREGLKQQVIEWRKGWDSNPR
ncbi:MAG: GAF domain-containing protein [Blastocatellia bacterium]|nr:GAF domain-containing protein [Blastocatellia bacterium]